MATSYAEIFEDFIFKVRAYELMVLVEETREYILQKYMKSVCRKFNQVCKVDLTQFDDELGEFIVDLSEKEKDIITEGMITEWLKPMYYSDELIESRLNLKDYTEFSPAKLIEQVKAVYLESKANSKQLIINYTYSFGDIADISKKK